MIHTTKIKRKIGRPITYNPKKYRITIGFTENQYAALKDIAEFHKVTLSTLVKDMFEIGLNSFQND